MMRKKSPAPLPDYWLRGPLEGIAASLQPVAHALLQCQDDLEASVRDLPKELIHTRPGGAASIAFHLRHFAGATERLFTYARGEELSEGERSRLAKEKVSDPSQETSTLLAEARRVVKKALDQLKRTPTESLTNRREVGRAQLPSTVLGLLFHAAEHGQRHTGQVITTAKILRGLEHGC